MSAAGPPSNVRVFGGLNDTRAHFPHVRSGDDGQVGEAGDADQRLIDQDGVHGLLDAVLRLQRGQQQFHLLPVGGGDNRKRPDASEQTQPKRSRPRLACMSPPPTAASLKAACLGFFLPVMQVTQENKAAKDSFVLKMNKVIGIMNNAYIWLSLDFEFVFEL